MDKKNKKIFRALGIIIIVGVLILAAIMTFTSEKYSDSESNEIISQYKNLIVSTTDEEEITNFVLANIDKSSAEEADEFFYGFVGIKKSGIEVKFKNLEAHKEKFTKETAKFFDIVVIEENKSAWKEDKIDITLMELMQRALKVEDYIREHPSARAERLAYSLYSSYIKSAVTGQVDYSLENSENIYLNDDKTKVDQKAVEQYEIFAEENPYSVTASIIKEYLEILKNVNYNYKATEVITFYSHLDQNMIDKLEIN